MARPLKNNADYFPHDADMRNDPRIKAVRRKFGVEGYGIYSMFLEFLCDAEFFEFRNDSLSIELIAGDFDVSPERLTEVLEYCIKLDLFQVNRDSKIVDCKSLDNRLEALLSKRKRDRIELPTAITLENGVIDSESTQSKVNKSIVEETKEKESTENETAEVCVWPTFDDFWDLYDKKADKPRAEAKWKKIHQEAREKIILHVADYVKATPDKQYRKHPVTYLNNESWNNEIIKPNGKQHAFNPAESAKRIDEILKARGDS